MLEALCRYKCGVPIIRWNHLFFLPQGNRQLIHSNQQALTAKSAYPRSRSDTTATGQGSQPLVLHVLA